MAKSNKFGNLSPAQRLQIQQILSVAESARWCQLDLGALTVTPLEGIPSMGILGFASTFRANGEVYMSVIRESSNENAFYRWNPTTGETSKAFDVTGAQIAGVYNLALDNDMP